MGQKTHPGGFRLNTTQEHYSSWYQKSWSGYSKNLERDDRIRTLLKQKLPSTSIVKITIKQDYYPKMLNINVFVDKPILPLKLFESEYFNTKIRKIINNSIPYGINLYSISEPDANASILADPRLRNCMKSAIASNLVSSPSWLYLSARECIRNQA